MESSARDEFGTIRISDNAIAVISGLAALEVGGVVALHLGAVDGLVEMLGVKSYTGRGVKVDVSEGEVVLELNLVVEFGVDIPVVCQKVQDNVRETVEDMTGLRVSRVDISVQGVKMRKEKSAKPLR